MIRVTTNKTTTINNNTCTQNLGEYTYTRTYTSYLPCKWGQNWFPFLASSNGKVYLTHIYPWQKYSVEQKLDQLLVSEYQRGGRFFSLSPCMDVSGPWVLGRNEKSLEICWMTWWYDLHLRPRDFLQEKSMHKEMEADCDSFGFLANFSAFQYLAVLVVLFWWLFTAWKLCAWVT